VRGELDALRDRLTHACVGSGVGVFLDDVGDLPVTIFEEFFRTRVWVRDIVVHEDQAFAPTGYHGVQVLEIGSGEG